ncbi:MAG TPA: hypothetical protein VG844_15160 [Terracidiphilus sp.]|nr:hypothetical protein [Terracidiphilus sp.]
MTTTNHRCVYQSALASARAELDEILATYNKLLARQKYLKTAEETLEALLASHCISKSETPGDQEIHKTANLAVESRKEASAPLSSRAENPIAPPPQPSVPVQQLPSDPILRRIHSALDLVSVA